MQLGDVVLVTVADGDVDTVCPAIVTKVWTQDDANGDSQWWDAVKDKGLCSLVAFTPGLVPVAVFDASIKAVSYKDDQGRTRIQHGTYQEKVSGSTSVATPSVPTIPTPVAPVAPTPVPAPEVPQVPQPETPTTSAAGSDSWTLTPPTPAS